MIEGNQLYFLKVKVFCNFNESIKKCLMKLFYQKLKTFDLYFIFILSVYFFSRLYLYLILKFEFTSSFKETLIQYLDVDILKNNLFESLFYLHCQPPLFNFLIGVTEITFGSYSSLIYLLIFNIIGCLTAILGFKIFELLDVNKKLAVFFIGTYILTPATILYENLFFYTHTIIFFLVFSAYQFISFLKNEKFINVFMFFLGLSFATLTTSYFHLLWFTGLVLFLLKIKKTLTKLIIKAALVPFGLVLFLYVKNFIVFNEFNTSSWFGLNLSRITVHQLDNATKDYLLKQDLLSPFSAYPPFNWPSKYDSALQLNFQNNSGIKALDQIEKPNGRPNFNNLGYITVSRSMFKDDLFVIKNYPAVYLKGIFKSFTKYFDSPTDYKLIALNKHKIEYFNKIFDAFIYGSFRDSHAGYITILLYLAILFFSIKLLFSGQTTSLNKAFISFALLNLLYVMFVGNLFEFGENNRFRYYTEIFSIVLLGIIINEFLFRPLSYKFKLK